MPALTERNCTYCAETIQAAAEICRYCNRAVGRNVKLCSSCCEPIRAAATRCRFCLQAQTTQPVAEQPAVNGIAPGTFAFGFQIPVHTPVYTPIEPKKLPEQCLAQKEFETWKQKRRDAITNGDKHE